MLSEKIVDLQIAIYEWVTLVKMAWNLGFFLFYYIFIFVNTKAYGPWNFKYEELDYHETYHADSNIHYF